ncbi:MAG: HD domain-containing protein [Pseudomonadales bacterium]|nr:HD domain-containing protein [Pseudomonadales bacterium]
MNFVETIPLLDEILEDWKPVIGEDYQGYRNHCTRMLQCCFALAQRVSEEDKKKLTIAAAFHDIGIWIDDTVDYIPPSLPPAKAYLEDSNQKEWLEEIELMITEHHKLTAYSRDKYPLVELFRKADLVDFSLGSIRFGMSKQQVNELKAILPNAGFHKMLAGRALKWFLKHPLNPAPMMKW